MPTSITPKTIAIVNGTGRQAASVIRTVSAVGHRVHAQVHSRVGLVAEELAQLPNVTLFEGSLLNNPSLIDALFSGAHLAFINTISQAGDEVAIGRALADGARRAGPALTHFVYSSMPDHSAHHLLWPALPSWACKFTVENYIRQLGLPATFVYAGIYNNNFTSLPYPLFCMDFQDDGSIEWKAPFHPDTKLPWLDAEHDVGPAVLQLFKDGPTKWGGKRVALAFENLTPLQVCAAFSRALSRPVRYTFSNSIDIRCPIPHGYREQLAGIEILFGHFNAPYFPGQDFEYDGGGDGRNSRTRKGSGGSGGGEGAKRKGSNEQPANNVNHINNNTNHHHSHYTSTNMADVLENSEIDSLVLRNSNKYKITKAGGGVGPDSKPRTMSQSSGGSNKTLTSTSTATGPRRRKLTNEARGLWAAYRGMEEYAREVFPVEEEANGKTWMLGDIDADVDVDADPAGGWVDNT